MKKMFVTLETGYCGSTGHELVEFDDNATEEQIAEECYWMAVQHAQSYGYEMCSDDCEDADCDMEHPGTSNIEGYAEPYDPEKHDGLLY